MNGLIISDLHSTAGRICQILNRGGIECPDANVVSTSLGVSLVPQLGPSLIVLVEAADARRTQDVIRQLRATTAVPLAVVGNALDTPNVLNAVRAGASDFLDHGDHLENELTGFLSRLQHTSAPSPQQGTLISLVSGSGGAGCSVLATNLAVALAQEHGPCGLVDLQLRGGDLATLLDLKRRHSIVDLCRNEHKLDRGMVEHSLLTHPSGVSLLAGPGMLDSFVPLSATAVRQVIQLAKEIFPYVVVDLEDPAREGLLDILAASDLVLILFRLDLVSLLRARKTLVHLERLGLESHRVQLVGNRWGQPQELAPARAAEALEAPIDFLLPEDSKTVIASINVGNPAVLESPYSKISKAIFKLAASIAH